MEVFLERKLKRGGVVRKWRVAVSPEAVPRLALPVNGHRWEGTWFQQRTDLRGLRPVVMMNYQRVARLGTGADGRYRVTLDRQLRARAMDYVRVPERIEGVDLLDEHAILEVKFAHTLPGPFRGLIENLALEEVGFSKFRLGVRSCGLVIEPVSELIPGAPTSSEPGRGPVPAMP